ncbi:MAG: hypothetical protein ACKN9V_04910 [Pseudomonadota bacterium]
MKLSFFLILVALMFGQQLRAEEKPETKATRGYYLGLGPTTLTNLNSNGVGYFFSGGYAFNYEQTMLKLNADVLGRSGALILSGGIGFSYFLQNFVFQELNPFIGADFSFATARIRPNETGLGEWVTGFMVGPQIGVQVFRNSDVLLEVAAKWATFLESGSLGTPSYGVLKISLYFL